MPVAPSPNTPGAVAVVVPCYNAERTLAETLASALDEAGIGEIVVVDDGSTDGSLAVARSFEPRVRVLSGPNRGVSAARNRGIGETTAEWLLFLDADDLLVSGTIAARLAAAEPDDADVVICGWSDLIDDARGTTTPGQVRGIDWSSMAADAELATATHAWATTAAILYRRRIVQRIGGFRQDLPIIQDARFLFDAAYHGARFAKCDHVGAHYRVLASSLSRRDPARFSLDILTNAQQIDVLWQASGHPGPERLSAISGMYDLAARGLFRAAHPRYFEAVAALHRRGLPQSRHSRIAAPLARLVGLPTARATLARLGRN